MDEMEGIMIDTLFFDLDGTLLDTEKDIRDCMLMALTDLKLPTEGFNARMVIGPPIWTAVRNAFPDIDDETVRRFIEIFRAKYDESTYPGTKAYPGIDALLRKLKTKKYRLYVATNKRRIPAQRLVTLFHWDGLFDDVLAVDMIPDKQIPKTQMLLLAMGKANIPRANAVMIGDTPGDINAGRDVMLRTIGVTWGYSTREEILAAHPSGLADSAEMIADLVRIVP